MKSFKCLLALPLLVTSLTACGGKEEFTESDYAKVNAIVDNYATSVQNSKAAGIAVSGRINKINIKGDATWWSYAEQEQEDDPEPVKPVPAGNDVAVQSKGKQMKGDVLGFLSMIPNFSIKNGEINIDPQDIATFSLPASLTSVAETYFKALAKKEGLSTALTVVLANLPKFPMNTNLLKAVNGIKEIKFNKETELIDWDNLEYQKWDYGTVSYFTSGARVKVTIETDDIETFMWEIGDRFSRKGEHDPKPEPEKKYPASFSVTTNKIGYIDSLSINLKLENEKFEQADSSLYYIYLNGDIDIDLALTFKQTISDPITVKYQVTAYREKKDDEDKVDAVYGSEEKLMPLIRDKIVDPTTNLSELKDYVTFDWYSNIETNDSGMPISLKKIYDDPIFCRDYWKGNEKNVAFLNQAYDVVVLPSLTQDSTTKVYKPNYQILGAIKLITSLNSISVDGRVISDKNALSNKPGDKLLVSAADRLMGDVTIYGEDGKPMVVENAFLDEIFINSNVLESRTSECIINISVLKIDNEK